MTLSIIVAVSDNGVIGRGGDLPWRLPRDLKHFKELTVGHPVIMGRRTFESIGRPLPDRTNIVLTRDEAFGQDGVIVAHSLQGAIALADAAPANPDSEVFIIGGAEIFRLAIPLADRVYQTQVHASAEGDTFMPRIDLSSFRLVNEQRHAADERNEHAMTFRCYERASRPAGARTRV